MWIECLIKRDGPTFVTIDKFDYCFKENPDFGGAAVCDVTNDSHITQLMVTGLYRKYEGVKPSESPDPKSLPGTEPDTVEPESNPEPDTTPELDTDAPDGEEAGQDDTVDEDTEGIETSEEDGTDGMTDEELDAAILNMADSNMSYAKIGEVVGKSKSWVGNRIKILREQKG